MCATCGCGTPAAGGLDLLHEGGAPAEHEHEHSHGHEHEHEHEH